ncbi:MAG TPA: glycosyltransferase family 4 protein [Candidatus Limnocylindrales bacterium]|nr:glycosyltransferase family 4 protein [Candidatus Limnocylindrales bacterium]
MTQPMIRVVVLHPRDLAAPTLGGIQTFLHDFVKHSPADFDITVAGVTQDPDERPIGRRSRVRIGKRDAWLLPLAPAGRMGRNPLNLWRMLGAQLRLRQLLLGRHAILQVHRPFRPLVLAGHRGPRVQFVHLDIRYWPGPSGWPRLGHLYRPFSDSAIERMARVYVVNEPGTELLRDAHPAMAERIEFIPVWFDEEVFRPPSDSERAALRVALLDRLGVPDAGREDRLILFAGRLEEVKDPALALAAFADVARRGRSVRLVVAGDGALREAMDVDTRQLGLAERVHFVGDQARDELAELMRATDVLLLSSRTEGGGPRVVLEALASGMPVVATPVGDVARTVRSGVNGWLTTGHDAAELADGLEWALDQPLDQVRGEAVAAVAPYTARRVLEPLYAAYRELAVAGADAQPAPRRST